MAVAVSLVLAAIGNFTESFIGSEFDLPPSLSTATELEGPDVVRSCAARTRNGNPAWRCVACKTTARRQCVQLRPRGRCRRFAWQDAAPAAQSHVARDEAHSPLYWRLAHPGTAATQLQRACSVSGPCFNLSRCSAGDLRVYVYPVCRPAPPHVIAH